MDVVGVQHIVFENRSIYKNQRPMALAKEEQGTGDGSAMRFRTTCWNLVFNSGNVERRCLKPTDDLTAEGVFDAGWANILIDSVMMRVSEEYRRQSKERALERLCIHLNLKRDETTGSYEESAKQLELSLAVVKMLVCRMRKRFAAFLRNEVAKTVLDPADIHGLYETLVAIGGRLER